MRKIFSSLKKIYTRKQNEINLEDDLLNNYNNLKPYFSQYLNYEMHQEHKEELIHIITTSEKSDFSNIYHVKIPESGNIVIIIPNICIDVPRELVPFKSQGAILLLSQRITKSNKHIEYYIDSSFNKYLHELLKQDKLK